MHADGESVTKPKRQAVATTSQKALEIRNYGTWSFGLAEQIMPDLLQEWRFSTEQVVSY
jgi:hypothetical protein